jgi:hypothetical protein
VLWEGGERLKLGSEAGRLAGERGSIRVERVSESRALRRNEFWKVWYKRHLKHALID